LAIVGPFALTYLLFFTPFVEKIQSAEGAIWAVSYIVLLGVLGTAIALVLFNKLVQITEPVFTSSVTYLIPIVAVCWGVLDGEVFGVYHVLGMLGIIAGVYLANKK
jgi:drug/metabolite transporter (DMT)-like permease